MQRSTGRDLVSRNCGGLFACIAPWVMLTACLHGLAQRPIITQEELKQRYTVVETVDYGRPVVLASRATADGTAVREQRSGRVFRSHLEVLVGDGDGYTHRFTVHAATDALLAVSRNVGRTMGLLWSLADARLGKGNTRLRAGAVDVWLCNDHGESGAEQSRRDLYVYDVARERSGLEWLRTLAHEFGHYVLPGPVGYSEPEAWSNGVLGERLFLGWLRDELEAGTLKEDLLPFATAQDVREYCARQTDALLGRILARGPQAPTLAGRDKKAMDEASALLIYASYVHQPSVLQEVLVYLPVQATKAPRGPDFLAAYELWLASLDVCRYRLLQPEGQYVYVPSGTWSVTSPSGGLGSLRIANVESSGVGESMTVRVPRGRWTVVTLRGAAARGLVLELRRCKQ